MKDIYKEAHILLHYALLNKKRGRAFRIILEYMYEYNKMSGNARDLCLKMCEALPYKLDDYSLEELMVPDNYKVYGFEDRRYYYLYRKELEKSEFIWRIDGKILINPAKVDCYTKKQLSLLTSIARLSMAPKRYK